MQDPPRQEAFGAEAWLLDPEDNRLLLLLLPWGSRQLMRAPKTTSGRFTQEPIVQNRDLGRGGGGAADLIIAKQILILRLPKIGHPLARQNRQQHQGQDPHQHSPKDQVGQRKT